MGNNECYKKRVSSAYIISKSHQKPSITSLHHKHRRNRSNNTHDQPSLPHTGRRARIHRSLRTGGGRGRLDCSWRLDGRRRAEVHGAVAVAAAARGDRDDGQRLDGDGGRGGRGRAGVGQVLGQRAADDGRRPGVCGAVAAAADLAAGRGSARGGRSRSSGAGLGDGRHGDARAGAGAAVDAGGGLNRGGGLGRRRGRRRRVGAGARTALGARLGRGGVHRLGGFGGLGVGRTALLPAADDLGRRDDYRHDGRVRGHGARDDRGSLRAGWAVDDVGGTLRHGDDASLVDGAGREGGRRSAALAAFDGCLCRGRGGGRRVHGRANGDERRRDDARLGGCRAVGDGGRARGDRDELGSVDRGGLERGGGCWSASVDGLGESERGGLRTAVGANGDGGGPARRDGRRGLRGADGRRVSCRDCGETSWAHVNISCRDYGCGHISGSGSGGGERRRGGDARG